MSEDKVRKGMGAAAVGLAGATGLAVGAKSAIDGAARRKPAQRPKTKAQTRFAAQAKDTKIKTAQIKVDQLKSIQPKDLNARDVKVRKALLQQQNEIIKGLTKTPTKELAKKFALRSIPFVGAFLAAFTPKPAGQGSALTGSGSKKKP